MQFSTTVAKTFSIWTEIKKAIPTSELISLPGNTAVKPAEHSESFPALEMSVQV